MGSFARRIRRQLTNDVRSDVKKLVDAAVRNESHESSCLPGRHLACAMIRAWSIVLTYSIHENIEHWYLSVLAPEHAPLNLDDFNQICDEIEKRTRRDDDTQIEFTDLTPADAPDTALHTFTWHSDGSPVDHREPAGFGHFRQHEEQRRLLDGRMEKLRKRYGS